MPQLGEVALDGWDRLEQHLNSVLHQTRGDPESLGSGRFCFPKSRWEPSIALLVEPGGNDEFELGRFIPMDRPSVSPFYEYALRLGGLHT